MKYIWLALRYNLDAQANRRLELITGIVAMILNNILYFGSVSVFLFHDRPENKNLFSYYLATQAIIFIAWGVINFLTRGFRELGMYIESGLLETFLARPRSPLLLAGLSRTDVTAAGDLLQGIVTVPICGALFGWDFALRLAFAAVLATVGIYSLMVFAGALAFFASRGAALSDFVLQATLILIGWPIAPKLKEVERLLLNLTPVGVIIFLPMDAVWQATPSAWLIATAAALFAATFATLLFSFGLRNFQSANAVRMVP
jgi:ABC-type uncharacterized transport system permease subunit